MENIDSDTIVQNLVPGQFMGAGSAPSGPPNSEPAG
jgi:hypothetical protein